MDAAFLVIFLLGNSGVEISRRISVVV